MLKPGCHSGLRDRNRLMLNFLARPERLELPTYWFEAGERREISELQR